MIEPKPLPPERERLIVSTIERDLYDIDVVEEVYAALLHAREQLAERPPMVEEPTYAEYHAACRTAREPHRYSSVGLKMAYESGWNSAIKWLAAWTRQRREGK